MPHWVRLTIILAMAVWAGWYFSKQLWVAIRTGRVTDSNSYYNRPVTRATKPIAFWLSVVVSMWMVVMVPYLIVLIVGDLAGFWESGV